ncbi:transporter [Dyadobacter subterraneus]|uniref:Transporter n=1 Tax=Dyadobacter subterraneus TaxID=2773304 RepID=A0ABR9W796_9BACT|nr:transporter [Dyadobacter subterraneus]MBE9461340.1 transporter [Dyadobacter subterraneus]
MKRIIGGKLYFTFLITLLFLGNLINVQAQDPVLPATNLGLTNMLDGAAPPPGFYYQNYTQVYKANGFYDSNGKKTSGDLNVNYLLSLHQFIYLSKIPVLHGNLEFTVILPLVKLSATGTMAKLPGVNPVVLGDVTVGGGIQWSDKKLFNKGFWSRAEIDLTIPSGSGKKEFNINPSAQLYTLSAYYAFTFFLNKKFSVSSRNIINYNFNKSRANDRPGAFYNVNYSAEYTLVKTLRAEVAGYYLKQFRQDSFNGNSHYYQEKMGVADTREQIFAVGPGLSYQTSSGVFLEAKVFFETAAKNRFEGVKPSFRIGIPLK